VLFDFVDFDRFADIFADIATPLADRCASLHEMMTPAAMPFTAPLLHDSSTLLPSRSSLFIFFASFDSPQVAFHD